LTQKDPADTAPGVCPNLALSDFFLFGFIMRKVTEYDISDQHS
jgi:hypothetical protein